MIIIEWNYRFKIIVKKNSDPNIIDAINTHISGNSYMLYIPFLWHKQHHTGRDEYRPHQSLAHSPQLSKALESLL